MLVFMADQIGLPAGGLFNRKLNLKTLRESLYGTFNTMGYIFAIIAGASVFAFVARGLGRDEIIEEALLGLPLSETGLILFILFCIFLMGFFFDWIEITFIILPLIIPVVAEMDLQLRVMTSWINRSSFGSRF